MAAKPTKVFIVNSPYEYARLKTYIEEQGGVIESIKTYEDNTIKVYALGDRNNLDFAWYLTKQAIDRIDKLNNEGAIINE